MVFLSGASHQTIFPPNAGLYIGAISGSTGASTNSGVQVASIAGVATKPLME